MSHDENGMCSKAYQIDNIEAMCREMHKVMLVGNGKPALTTRIEVVENQLMDITAAPSIRRDMWTAIGAVGAFLVACAALLLSIMKIV